MTTIKDRTAQLEAWLSEKVQASVRVLKATPLAGGASRDTWAMEIEIAGEGPHALVLRRDLGGEIDDRALSREQEFRLLELVHLGGSGGAKPRGPEIEGSGGAKPPRGPVSPGVLVPRPRWLCTDPTVLGAAFFLMDRLEGEAVGRRVVREPALQQARQRLPAQMGEQLARIHQLPLEEFDFLPRPDQGISHAQRTVDDLTAQLDRFDEPHPALEIAIRWLREHAPEGRETVLVHGDFRIGNLMVNPEGLVGVFDWEFAHLGDPAEDLAWPCVRSWRFGRDAQRLGGVGQPEPFIEAYQNHRGVTVDLASVHYWEVLGNLRWAVGCIAQANRHLSGEAPSIELASLGRRTAEMELELLDLIQ